MNKDSGDPFYHKPWSPDIQKGCVRLVWHTPENMPPRNIHEVLRHELGCSGTVMGRLRLPGLLLVDGIPARVQDRIGPGSLLEIWLSEPEDSNLKPEPLPIAVLYEDEHLIAVDKSDRIPVHPSTLQRSGTLANAIAWHLQQHGEGRRVHPVTRLDRNTAGITLFAKTAHAQHVLSQQAETGQFDKEYLGVAMGSWTNRPASFTEYQQGSQTAGTIRLPIRRKAGSIIERETHPEGDASITHFEVLSTFVPIQAGGSNAGGSNAGGSQQDTASKEAGIPENPAPSPAPFSGVCSLVRFRLETGRTHQIRVHCQALGHPLLGDTLYGGPEFPPLAGQALVCDRLLFVHPVSRERVEIRSRRDFPMFRLGFDLPD